jgi:hypothetical protein
LKQRLEDFLATSRSVIAEPHSVGPMLRDGLVQLAHPRRRLLRSGYVICFVVLEIRMFAGDALQSDGVVSFVVMEFVGLVFRVTVQSFLNGLLAFGWPVFVLELLEGWGILLIGVLWVVFDRWATRINVWLAERNAGEEQEPSQRSSMNRVALGLERAKWFCDRSSSLRQTLTTRMRFRSRR